MNCWSRFWLGVALAGLVGAAWALNADEQRELGDGLFARGLHELALREYRGFLAAASNSPACPAIFFRAAECERALGQTTEADRDYRIAYAATGASVRAQAGLRGAEYLAERGQTAAAIEWMAELRGIAAGETGAAVGYLYGLTLEQAGRTNDAVQAYEQVRVRYPDTAQAALAALALGGVMALRGDAASALGFYEAAAIKPATARSGAEAWFQIGELRFRQKQWSLAARAYEHLWRDTPSDERLAAAWLPMAWSFQNAGFYADALRVAEAARKAGAAVTPERDAEWLYLEANAHRQLLQYDAAAGVYSNLLARYPASGPVAAAAYERALALHKAGRAAEARLAACALIPLPAQRCDVAWLIAESSVASGATNDAIQAYRIVREQFPENELAPEAAYRLGHLLRRNEQFVVAAAAFEDLARTWPKHALAPRGLFAAAEAWARAGRDDAAVGDWTRLTAEYAQSDLLEESLYQKAALQTRRRHDADALAAWQELLARAPATRHGAEAHFWRGVMAEEGGRTDSAEAEYRAAMAAAPAADLQPRLRYRLALTLQRRNRPEASAEAAALMEGLLTSPEQERFPLDVLEWLAEYQAGQSNGVGAAATAGRLARRADDDSWRQRAAYWLARAELAQGHAAAAEAALRGAVAYAVTTPVTPQAWMELGALTLKAGQAAEARVAFEHAAALSQGEALLSVRARAYAGLARAYEDEGNLDAAVRHYLSVGLLFDNPDVVPDCLTGAARVLRAMGRTAEADKVAEELRQRYPGRIAGGKL
ncbi:MAG: tetratricopeptide repeat protein [bacterium]